MAYMPCHPCQECFHRAGVFLFRRAAPGVELLKKGIVFNEIDYLYRSHFLHFNPRRAREKAPL